MESTKKAGRVGGHNTGKGKELSLMITDCKAKSKPNSLATMAVAALLLEQFSLGQITDVELLKRWQEVSR